MKIRTIVGIVLILFGLAAFVFQGIPYQSEEGTLQVGPVKAEVETQEEISLPPFVGIVSLAAGVILLAVGSRRE